MIILNEAVKRDIYFASYMFSNIIRNILAALGDTDKLHEKAYFHYDLRYACVLVLAVELSLITKISLLVALQ